MCIRDRVYGNDMLYVTAPDGSKIGRVNLQTGRVTMDRAIPVSYTHLRAHETVLDLVCRLLLEKKQAYD